jgi:hypothetical protein
MADTTQLHTIVPKVLDEALAKEAKKQKRRKADIVREALGEYLKARGVDVETDVEHGGYRPKKDGEQ